MSTKHTHTIMDLEKKVEFLQKRVDTLTEQRNVLGDASKKAKGMLEGEGGISRLMASEHGHRVREIADVLEQAIKAEEKMEIEASREEEE